MEKYKDSCKNENKQNIVKYLIANIEDFISKSITYFIPCLDLRNYLMLYVM